MHELISIIIPAYNQADYIGEAVQSVINQTYPAWECIIVNDGSTDHTAEEIKKIQHPQLIYVYQENRGLSAARNTGIRNTKGKYLSFLDSDDCFTPDKLSVLMHSIDNNPELALVAGTASLIDQNGKAINRPFSKVLPQDLRDLLLGNPLHVGSVLLKRSWQEKIGFFDESLRSYEDWDYWLRLAIAGAKMESVDTPVSYYRFHTAQMTRNQNQMTEASFAVLDKVFQNGNLPQSWCEYKHEAYSQSHLRASANSYAANDFQAGKLHLKKAVSLNPVLLQDNSYEVFQQILAWTELPKVKEPLVFLKNILNHLPNEIKDGSSYSSRQILSKFAIEQGFTAFEQRHFNNARTFIIFAVKNNPRWLFNRGVISILLKSNFREIGIQKTDLPVSSKNQKN